MLILRIQPRTVLSPDIWQDPGRGKRGLRRSLLLRCPQLSCPKKHCRRNWKEQRYFLVDLAKTLCFSSAVGTQAVNIPSETFLLSPVIFYTNCRSPGNSMDQNGRRKESSGHELLFAALILCSRVAHVFQNKDELLRFREILLLLTTYLEQKWNCHPRWELSGGRFVVGSRKANIRIRRRVIL